jgi:hypothetical protein
MQQAIQRGLRAGALAGLLLIGIFFINYGPATNLTTIARWFALDGNAWSKLIGAIFLVVLGAVFGGLFGAFVRLWSPSLFHSVLVGLVTGLGFWVLLVLFLSTGVRHIQQSLYGTLFWLVTSLLYGLVLGSLYGTFQKQEGAGEL